MLAAILMPIFRKKVLYEIKSRAVGRDEQGYSDRNRPHPLCQFSTRCVSGEIKIECNSFSLFFLLASHEGSNELSGPQKTSPHHYAAATRIKDVVLFSSINTGFGTLDIPNSK